MNSSIAGYLPEKIWEIAHHKKLVILLHVVRYYGLADPENYSFIRKMCKKYQNVKLVLAHMGCGFNTYVAENGFDKLLDIDNIWFDTSAVCESSTFVSCIRRFRAEKILWGTDYPICQRTGRCFTFGDGFLWLDEQNFNWRNFSSCRPVSFGMESLRALRQAAEHTGLGKTEIQNIFCFNAINLLKK